MSRIAWALALAFVAHLVLFWVWMPEQQQAQLSLAGSAHVSARLAQSRSEPVAKVIAEPEADPVGSGFGTLKGGSRGRYRENCCAHGSAGR